MCMHVCMYASMHVCMQVCKYASMHICIHTYMPIMIWHRWLHRVSTERECPIYPLPPSPLQLLAFLYQRQLEMQSESSAALEDCMVSSAPPLVQQQGADSLKGLQEGVRAALEPLTCKRTGDLLRILTAPRWG